MLQTDGRTYSVTPRYTHSHFVFVGYNYSFIMVMSRYLRMEHECVYLDY